MNISLSTINKVKENYKSLGILEAIDAFYRIIDLVFEKTPKHPYQLQEALLQLHDRLLTLIQAHPQEENLKGEDFKKLIDFIEEDVDRIINNAELILITTYKVKKLFSFFSFLVEPKKKKKN